MWMIVVALQVLVGQLMVAQLLPPRASTFSHLPVARRAIHDIVLAVATVGHAQLLSQRRYGAAAAHTC